MGFANGTGLPEGCGRYKGNLHSHTTASDGCLTPEESAAAFRAHGYSFLCQSEHDVFTDRRAELNTGDFILLPGLEASTYLMGPDGPDGRPRALACHHLLGILGTAEMQAAAPRRFEHGEWLEPPRAHGTWDGAAAAQAVVDELAARGCFALYNHPIWSRVGERDFAATQGLSGLEIFNYNTVNECGEGADTTYWDAMLRRGVRINCFASDDNHNGGVFDDAFGGWIVACAPELSHDAIVRAIMAGEYYSSSGPEIVNYGVQDGVAWVACSPCERITMIAGGFIGASCTKIAAPGAALERAAFPLRGGETYLRFECRDAAGRTAWTNPLYAELRPAAND